MTTSLNLADWALIIFLLANRIQRRHHLFVDGASTKTNIDHKDEKVNEWTTKVLIFNYNLQY